MPGDNSLITDVVRTELEKGRDAARQEFQKNAEGAREEIDRRADGARSEMGNRIVDLTEEYFPQEVARRRRRQVATAFAAGVGAGVAARHFLSR